MITGNDEDDYRRCRWYNPCSRQWW